MLTSNEATDAATALAEIRATLAKENPRLLQQCEQSALELVTTYGRCGQAGYVILSFIACFVAAKMEAGELQQ